MIRDALQHWIVIALLVASIVVLARSAPRPGRGCLIAFASVWAARRLMNFVVAAWYAHDYEWQRTSAIVSGELSVVMDVSACVLLLVAVLQMRHGTGALAGSAGALQGYGGWLRFFCVTHIYVAPIVVLIATVRELNDAVDVARQFPAITLVAVIACIANVAVTVYGVWCAVGLRRLDPRAVHRTRTYLWSGLAASAAALLLPFAAGLPLDALREVYGAQLVEFTKALAVFGIWFAYFSVSKRIQATFPTAAALNTQ